MTAAEVTQALEAALAATSSAVLLGALLLLAHRARALARRPFVPQPLPAGEPPLVSILVPARDEERSLEPCLRSLLAQSYPRLEVLVWDDDSRDTTHAIAARLAAEDSRLRVFRGSGPPPPGWIGKCHALDRLSREARGTWLLCTDADTVHAVDGLASGLGFALARGLEAVTASGEGVLVGFWEKAWEPLWPAFLLAWLRPDQLDDPDAPLAFGVGQWFLLSRRAYDRIGGHAAVRDQIVEDCALVARLKRARLPFRVLLGTRLFRVRMYRSRREIVEGWSKNADLALRLFGGGPLAAPISALLILLATVVPFALALATLVRAAAAAPLAVHGAAAPGQTALAGPGSLLVGLGPAVLALAASLLLRLRRGEHRSHFWTLPLAGLLAALVLANSAVRSRAGLNLVWKGRAYPGGRPAGG